MRLRDRKSTPVGDFKPTKRKVASSPSRKMSLDSRAYYHEYYGHKNSHNETVFQHLTAQKKQATQPTQGKFDGIIYLAGDSSLDNKNWFRDTGAACNSLEQLLVPPVCVQDIAYWINRMEEEEASGTASRPIAIDGVYDRDRDRDKDALRYACINCAIEESTVGDRSFGRLLPQDRFIKEHITSDDILVVSVGGNDIALKPAPCTIIHMLSLVKCLPSACLQSCACGTACPWDDCLCGCTTGCISDLMACPTGVGYFIHLFKTRIEAYLQNLLAVPSASTAGGAVSWLQHLVCGTGCTPASSITRVKKVLICMIYYPDQKSTGSWADGTLGALGYNKSPRKLQLIIRTIFMLATQRINIPGVQVVGVPLFARLDGKDTKDYSQRVEPSAQGGEKMAQMIHTAIHDPSAGCQSMQDLYNAHVRCVEKEEREGDSSAASGSAAAGGGGGGGSGDGIGADANSDREYGSSEGGVRAPLIAEPIAAHRGMQGLSRPKES